MKKIVFALPGNESLGEQLAAGLRAETGSTTIRRFPDGESYVRVLSDVSRRHVILVATLDRPDTKVLPLYFLAKLLKELGAAKLSLFVPYLAYMRQDKQFKPGEAVTSVYFAQLLSSIADELITVDPHLHRWHSLSEIYQIPCKVLHVSRCMSEYVRTAIPNALLIGPDSESEQWVSEVAKEAAVPYMILQKERLGDRQVSLRLPAVEQYKGRTPVLVDDIISTAQTMIRAVSLLERKGMGVPVCMGVHGIFADDAYADLLRAGVTEIITCNSVKHPSNKLDVSRLAIEALR